MAKEGKKIIEKPLVKEKLEKFKKTKIKVIGIGGGAGNIVSEIASRIEKADFLVANTDLQALKTVNRKVVRFPFGQSFTKGLGTGMNPELGEMAAKSEKEKIKKILTGQDLLIILACLGGGVSSGATPFFAKISQSLGNLTYGIFTLPFKFEGEKKMEIAKISLEKLKSKLNVLSVIPNEKIFQTIDRNTPLKTALSAINKILAESLEGLIETIYQPGLINIDFADLKTILEGQGRLAFLNTAEISSQGQREEIKKVINCSLYPYTIRGAKNILFNITGAKGLSLAEVSHISKSIYEMVNPQAKIIFGISQNKKYQDKIKVSLLATGCATKLFSTGVKKRKLEKEPQEKTIKTIRTKPQSVKTKKKQRIKTRKKPKPKPRPKSRPKSEAEKVTAKLEIPQLEAEEKQSLPEGKVRKNALQIRKEVEKAEEELLKEEEKWEVPAFLRRLKSNQY